MVRAGGATGPLPAHEIWRQRQSFGGRALEGVAAHEPRWQRTSFGGSASLSVAAPQSRCPKTLTSSPEHNVTSGCRWVPRGRCNMYGLKPHWPGQYSRRSLHGNCNKDQEHLAGRGPVKRPAKGALETAADEAL